MGICAYTMISAEDGSEKRAENLIAGDRIVNPLSGGAAAIHKIWQGPGVGVVRISVDGGAVLDATGDQLVQAGNEMIRAGQVRPGMALCTDAGVAVCVDVSPLPGDYMVYDIVLENDGAERCFLANGLILGC